jgi:tetratricopeptide (TPR) repeat protein
MNCDSSTIEFQSALKHRRDGDLAAAADSCRRILSDNPRHVGAMQIVAEHLNSKRDFLPAIDMLRRAISEDMLEPGGHFYLGLSLSNVGSTEEAIVELKRALFLYPGNVQYQKAFASVLALHGETDAAVAEFQRIRKRSDDAETEFGLGSTYLAAGRYTEGWPFYESRWSMSGISRDQGLKYPMWDGSDPAGKRILLHTEQGYGDSIQFVRFAQLLVDAGASVDLLCPSGMKRLFSGRCGISRILVSTCDIVDYDFHCPLCSLPMLFKTELQTIPGIKPYLMAAPKGASRWSEEVKRFAGMKVGLCWASSQNNTKLWFKSIPAELLSPLNAVNHVQFFSLQKGLGNDADAKPVTGLVDWTARLNDFADTAALIQNLDLVVSVDTAVAHLAGAMGKPTWLLLASNADWRWLRDRSDSPWYPSMRLFRQARACVWEPVVEKVVAELNALVPRDSL